MLFFFHRLQKKSCTSITLDNFSLIHFSSTNYRLPTINYQLPTTNFQLPTTNYRLPTTNYRIPTTNYQLPTTDYQLPTANNYRLPTANYRLLTTYYQLIFSRHVEYFFIREHRTIFAYIGFTHRAVSAFAHTTFHAVFEGRVDIGIVKTVFT